MRRFATATAKAIVSANTARRTFYTVSKVTTRANTQAPAYRLASSLTECLNNEISEEQANNEIDQELVDVQKQVLKTFKLKEETGLGMVRLVKQHGDETIEVQFDVQDVDDNGMDEMDQEDEDEEIPSSMGINFQVTIKKGGDAIVVNAFASDAMNIQNIRFCEAKHASLKEEELYEGPSFEELEESLQAAFYEYLTERNIDDDLSFFVLAYSRDKEQREYTNWLNKLQNFTADK